MSITEEAAAAWPVGKSGTTTLDRLTPAEDNVRVNSDTEVEGLARSILANGLVQAIVVDPDLNIIAGHRRFAAYKWLIDTGKLPGDTPINFTVRAVNENQSSLQAMLVENLQRVDLDPVEEARGYARMKELGLSQKVIGERVGKSASLISHRLRLLKLPDSALAALQRGELGMDQAEAMVALADKPEVIEEIVLTNSPVWAIERQADQLHRDDLIEAMATKIEAQGGLTVKTYSELSAANLECEYSKSIVEPDDDALASMIEDDVTYYVTCNHNGEVSVTTTKPYEKSKASMNGGPNDAQKEAKEATKLRLSTVAEEVRVSSLVKADVEFIADQAALAGINNNDAKVACRLLHIDNASAINRAKEGEKADYDWKQTLADQFTKSGKTQLRARLALALASHEGRTGTYFAPSPEYVHALDMLGIRLNNKHAPTAATLKALGHNEEGTDE